MQWRIAVKDGIIVEVTEVVGVEGSRVLVERYLPLHDTVFKTVSCSAVDSREETFRLHGTRIDCGLKNVHVRTYG